MHSFDIRTQQSLINMEKIEIVNCPENLESIEVIIEVECPIQHRNFLQSVKRKIFKYKWEIAAGFVILCVGAIVLCAYFFTGNNSRSETQSTKTTTVIEAFDFGIASTTPITTTAATTSMSVTRRALDLDEILDSM